MIRAIDQLSNFLRHPENRWQIEFLTFFIMAIISYFPLHILLKFLVSLNASVLWFTHCDNKSPGDSLQTYKTKDPVDLEKFMGQWHTAFHLHSASIYNECNCPSSFYSWDIQKRFLYWDVYCLYNKQTVFFTRSKMYPTNRLNTKFQVFYQFNDWYSMTYQILDIDMQKYSWVLIGEPCRQWAWLWVRSRDIDWDIVQGKIDKLKELGYSFDKGDLVVSDRGKSCPNDISIDLYQNNKSLSIFEDENLISGFL